MAAIEKICEYSGEYPSWNMYGYKRNQLQIMPEYRKLFRGATATLLVHYKGKEWKYKTGGTSDYNKSSHKEEMLDYEPPFECYEEFMEYEKSRYGKRLVDSYEYVLQVKDEHLQGEVEGEYLNHTNNISTVKRKLKRLLRCKKLNIVYVDKRKDLFKRG